MRFSVLGVFSLSLRWAKTCLTRWQHCFHSLFCLFLAHLCLKLCPHRPLHLPARMCNTGHLFLQYCAEQYNVNVDLQVLVDSELPQRNVSRVALPRMWNVEPIWGAGPFPWGEGPVQRKLFESQLRRVLAAWPWAGHLTLLGLSLSSVIHKGSLLILLPLGSLGSVCFNRKGTCHEQANSIFALILLLTAWATGTEGNQPC